MARIRTIKPDACTSEGLAALEEATCWTFALLWTQCDDAGRHRSEPRLVKAGVAPLRDEVTPDIIRERLASLREAGMLCFYIGCDGKAYLHVVNWDHQKVDKASVSRTPPCREHEPDAECVFHKESRLDCVSSRDTRETLANPREDLGPVPRTVDLVPRTTDHGPRTTDLAPAEPSRGLASRRVDPLWDALMAACAVDTDSLTAAARGSYNAARKQLADVGATPDEISRRAANYRRHFPNAPLTPSALAKQWAQCAKPPAARGRPSTTDSAVNAALELAAKYAAQEGR